MTLLNRYQLDVAGLVGGPGLMTFTIDPAITENSAQDFVDAVKAFIGVFDLYTSTSITYRGFSYVEGFDSVTGNITGTEDVVLFTEAGDDSTTVLPPVNQLLVGWKTGVWIGTKPRQLQGRTFIPGLCEDANEAGGVPQEAICAVIQTAANNLATAAGLVVWSRTHGTFEPVSNASVKRSWAYLSGRRDG